MPRDHQKQVQTRVPASEPRGSAPESAPELPTTGSSPEALAPGYQPGSEQGAPGAEASHDYQSGSPDYQSGSKEPPPGGVDSGVDSGGYQSASDEPPSSDRPLESAPDGDHRDPPPSFALAVSKERDWKEREKLRREPGIWLPGGEELDQEPRRSEDAETRFSRDSWGGRGNPQVSVRLRPHDFGRLRQAADLYGVRPTTLARMMVIRGVGAILDAELRRRGEFLGEELP